MITAVAMAFALSQAGPSFDCARATTPAERAICSDAALARLDRRMNSLYVAVRRALPASVRSALAEDQLWFLSVREYEAEQPRAAGDNRQLAARMTNRIGFLESIHTRGRSGLTGRWRNLAGEVHVTAPGNGRMRIRINAAQPENGNWVCDVEFTGASSASAVEGVANHDQNYRLRATLRGDTLLLTETQIAGDGYGPGYCGLNGSVGGTYFRMQ